MPLEEHENLLNELLNHELDQTRRTEILQTLRTDYGSVLTDDKTKTEELEKMSKQHADLVTSNSMLFRQLGVQSKQGEDKEKLEDKQFSETVTIEQLEAK